MLVIWSLHAGGAERVMSHLANSWAEHHDVTLFTLDNVTPDHYTVTGAVERMYYRSIGTGGVRGRSSTRDAVQRAEVRRLQAWPVVRTVVGYVKVGRILAQLRSAIKEIRPDVVISFMDSTNNQVLMSTRGLHVPVVVSERVDPRFHGASWKTRILRRMLYPRASAVVVQTESVATWCRQFVDPERVWTIPNPVNECSQRPRVRKPLVVGIGRLVPQKGFDILVEAFGMAAGGFRDWKLIILGEGSERAHLQSLTQRYGVTDRVSFPGVVDDPGKYLARAGLFVLPSRYEGFPNALLEAMACGTPSIAADCPSGPSDIIRPGVDGVLVPTEDAQALSREMVRLIEDAEMRERLGRQATDVTSRFSLGRVLNQWSLVFQAINPPNPTET